MSKLSTNNLVLIIIALIVAGGAITVIFFNNQNNSAIDNSNTSVQNQNSNSNNNINSNSGNLINENATGTIEGSLSYPSEGIPADMIVCADNIVTQQVYCTEEQISDSKYVYGKGYSLSLSEGNYHVYATLSSLPEYKQYYSQAVICGMEAECTSHELIVVNVAAGESTTNIDPFDFEWDKSVSSNLVDYQSSTGNFKISYPSTWEFVQEFKIAKQNSFLEIYVLEKNVNQSLNEWLAERDENLDLQTLTQEYVSVGTLNGQKRTVATMGDASDPSTDIYLDDGDKVYELAGKAEAADQAEFDQIINSFQIL